MNLNTAHCLQCESMQHDRDMWHDEALRTRADLANARSQCETLRTALAEATDPLSDKRNHHRSQLDDIRQQRDAWKADSDRMTPAYNIACSERDALLDALQRIAREALASLDAPLTHPARSSADDCAKP